MEQFLFVGYYLSDSDFSPENESNPEWVAKEVRQEIKDYGVYPNLETAKLAITFNDTVDDYIVGCFLEILDDAPKIKENKITLVLEDNASKKIEELSKYFGKKPTLTFVLNKESLTNRLL